MTTTGDTEAAGQVGERGQMKAGTSQHEGGNEGWSQKAASVLGVKAPPRLVAGEGQI